MRHEVPGTLAYYLSAPHFQTMHAGAVMCSSVAKVCGDYKANCQKANPDKEAVVFYAMNQLSALISQKFTPYETLPVWANVAMEKYTNVVSVQTTRLFYYLCLIITREQRHLPKQDMGWWSNMDATFGAPFKTFATGIPGNEESAVQRFMSDPPAMSIVKFAEAMAHCFHKGKSWSSSYGGKKWGFIADCLARFTRGETSAEIMCDTAYTLAHNGGPMFNKGMMYGMYSNEIYKILDVQRGGMMCEALLDGTFQDHHAILPIIKDVKTAIGGIEDVVDWHKVDAAGALHGPYAAKLAPKVPPKPAAPPVWLPKGAKITGQFQVTPNEAVTMYKRAA